MKKIALILILAMLIALPLIGCSENEVEAPQKETGWIFGTGEPAITEGLVDGQLYFDEESLGLYEYKNSAWNLIGYLYDEKIEPSDEEPFLAIKDGEWYIEGVRTNILATGDNATVSSLTIVNGYWHINGVDTKIYAGGKADTPTPDSGKLTDEEFRAQPSSYGSPWQPNATTRIKITVKIEMSKGTKIKFLGDTSVYCWGVLETTNKDDPTASGVWKDSYWNTAWDDPTVDTYATTYSKGYFVLTVGKLDASGTPNLVFTQEELDNIYNMFEIDGIKAEFVNVNSSNNNGTSSNVASNENMVSINHRGWHQAPENTLSAYRESYLHGFKFVECDVQFTKDGIPVLLHDDTIDRTSNGSGNVSQMTYAELLEYDFSYDDNDNVNDFSAYRGEKIPTFEEFIQLCKTLDLCPYIEIKGSITDAQAKELIKIVANANMNDKVSYLSFSGDALSKVASYCPTARIVWVITDTNATKIASTNIPFAKTNLMTGQNQVVFDIWYTLATQEVVDVVSAENIPLEVWTINDINAIYNLHPYVSGVTSDYLNAKQILIDAELGN